MSEMDRATMRLSSSVKTLERRFPGLPELGRDAGGSGAFLRDELASARVCKRSMSAGGGEGSCKRQIAADTGRLRARQAGL